MTKEIKTFEELVISVRALLEPNNISDVDERRESFYFTINTTNYFYNDRRVFLELENQVSYMDKVGRKVNFTSTSIHSVNASYKGIYNIIKALKECNA